jgi:hypothetical protein
MMDYYRLGGQGLIPITGIEISLFIVPTPSARRNIFPVQLVKGRRDCPLNLG